MRLFLHPLSQVAVSATMCKHRVLCFRYLPACETLDWLLGFTFRCLQPPDPPDTLPVGGSFVTSLFRLAVLYVRGDIPRGVGGLIGFADFPPSDAVLKPGCGGSGTYRTGV